MNNIFDTKIRAAASASWRTLLVAAAVVTIQWLAYLVVMNARPAWAVALLGPGATWEELRTLWLYAAGLMKLSLWPLAVLACWLTFWAKRFRELELRSEPAGGPHPR